MNEATPVRSKGDARSAAWAVSLIVALSILVGSPTATAQAPDGWDWSSTLASSKVEFASAVAVDSLNSAVYTAGRAENGFSGILGGLWSLLFGSNTASDGYMLKRNLNGAFQWQFVLGGVGNDAITGVCTDQQGNIYVTGYFSGSNASFTGVTGASQTMSSTGGEDIFVACYNASGVLLWKIKAGGSGNDRGTSICYANGKIFIGGSFNGSPLIAGMATSSVAAGVNNRTHGFVVALQSSNGSGLWRVDGTNNENSVINAVATDGSRVYALGVHKGTQYRFVGTADPTGLTLATAGSNLSADVLAADNAGQLNWAQAVANPGTDNIQALGLAASSAAVYIAGSTHNNSVFPGGVTIGLSGNPHDHGYLARLRKSSGQTDWVRAFTGPSDHTQVGRAVTTDSHGDILLAGSYKEYLGLPGGTTLNGEDDIQVFVSKFNGAGDFKWAVTPTGDKDDEPNGVALDGNGGVYVAGSYQEDITFNIDYSDHDSQNLFIARLTDLDYAVAAFRNPSEFLGLAPICASDGPVNLVSRLIPARYGTGSSVYSSSGIPSSGNNGAWGALGQVPGGVAVFDNTNDQIVIDLVDTIPIGEKVILRWRSTGGTATMNVKGSLSGAGVFTDHGNITTTSTALVLAAVTVTAPMRFVKLTRGGGSTCEVDGIYYNFGSATDGTWSGAGVTGNSFDPSGLSGNVDITYIASGQSTTHTVVVSPVSVPGTLSGGATICPGSDSPLSLNGSIGSSLVWQTSTDGGTTWTSAALNQSLDTLFGVTQTTRVKVKVKSGVCPAVFSNTVTVIPLDTIAPVISGCPGNITLGTNALTCGAIVNYTAPTAMDDCAGALIVVPQNPAHASGNVFPRGATVVTLSTSDGSGNVSTCAFTITVVDTVKPMLSCPSAVAVSTNSGCSATGVVLGTPTASDNCGPVTVTNNAPSTYPLGVTNVTWTATDASGNHRSCIQQVTVTDTTPPSISCPPDKNVTVNAGCSATAVNLGTPVTADNCGIAYVGHNATSSFAMGVTTITWTVLDNAGNSNTCEQTVTVTDISAPTISCPPAVQVAANNGCTATGVVLGDPVAADNCDVASLTNNAPSAFPIGTTMVTWTAVDGSGNVATCAQTVTVTDNTPPTISCPANVQATTNSGCTATGINLGTPSVSDNCTGTTVSNNAPSAFPRGSTTVTWTATDASGNTATCAQTVTVTDNIPPVITCPANVQAYTNAGCTATGVNLGTPSVSDNCTSVTVSNNAPTAFPKGSTIVTWTATDASGNTATCAQTVIVTDNIPPVITCPANVQAYTNAGCTATGVNLGTPTASDNCTGVTVSNNAPAVFPKGTTTVTWTATDASGNIATCIQTVTVTDNIPPVITCPANVQANTNAGCTATGVNLGTPTASDNCTGVTVSNNAPANFPKGTTTVTWTATDGSGNTATCTQTVTVTDNIPPVITCPANVQVQTNTGCTASGVNLGTPSVSDNCSGVTVSNNAPTVFQIGSTTVTWTAMDASGNTATCTQSVTVADVIAPVISGPANVQVAANTGCTATGVALGMPSYSDNCSGTTISNNAPSAFPLGITTVTWTATDASGNTSTSTQAVTVTDQTDPAARCREATVNVDSTGWAQLTVAMVDDGSNDNCTLASLSISPQAFNTLGDHEVTLTATDAAGNSTSCVTLVHVVDNAPPMANCTNVTVYLDPSGEASISALDLDGGSTDNDSIVAYGASSTHFTCADVGAFADTLFVTDNGGNTSFCIAQVTVIDTISPIALGHTVQVYLDSSGAVTLAAQELDNGSSHACGGLTFTASDTTFSCAEIGVVNVLLTVTDANGNSASCNTEVIVNDTIAPTAQCQAVTAYLDATGHAQIAASAVDAGSTDNCSISSIIVNPSTVQGVGEHTVQLIVMDSSGNSDTCSAVVTVLDIMPPVALCNDTLLQLGTSGTATINAIDLDGGSTDNAGITQWAASQLVFGCADAGLNTDTLFVTDGSGNTAYCVSTITIVDPSPANAGVDSTVDLCAAGASAALMPYLGPDAQPGGSWWFQGGTATGMFDPALDTPGAYLYTVTNTSGCRTDSAVVTAVVHATADPGQDTSITVCSNDSAFALMDLLPGADPDGTWSNGSGWFNPGMDTPGELLYTVVGASVCPSATAVVSIEVNTAAYAGTGGSLAICTDAVPVSLFASLQGDPDTGGQWTDPQGQNTDGTFNPATMDAGVYTYTVSSMSPCGQAISTMVVSLTPQPSAAWSSPDPICSTEGALELSAFITGVPGGTWSGPGILPGSSAFDPGSITIQGSSTPIELTYTATDNGCQSSAVGIITVLATPIADAGADAAVCGLNTGLNASANIGSGIWTAGSGVVFGPENAADASVEVVAPGTYDLYWTVTNGQCAGTDTVLVTFNVPDQLGDVNAGEDDSWNIKRTFQLQGTADGATETRWTLLDGSGYIHHAEDLSTEVSELATGPNTFMLSARVGVCPFKMDTVVLVVRDLFIPSGYSPNGDGVNDNFEVIGIDVYRDNVLTVFNRWGQVVYHTEGYANEWNGQGDTGSPLMDDTYFYVLKFTGDATYNGQVIIKR